MKKLYVYDQSENTLIIDSIKNEFGDIVSIEYESLPRNYGTDNVAKAIVTYNAQTVAEIFFDKHLFGYVLVGRVPSAEIPRNYDKLHFECSVIYVEKSHITIDEMNECIKKYIHFLDCMEKLCSKLVSVYQQDFDKLVSDCINDINNSGCLR